MPDRFDVAVVGGGAAGLVAAVSAARRGASVVVLERMPRLGKKLLATGGGRGNLLNERLSAGDYTSTSPDLVAAVLGRFGGADIRAFFEGLGLHMVSDGTGRVYPVTNQASSVLRVLEIEIARLKVSVLVGFEVSAVHPASAGFSLGSSTGRRVGAASVILAAGGRSYPALGSDGGGFGLAERLGHGIVPPVPSAVPLVVRDRMCHLLQGQRIPARVTALLAGRPARSAEGELLFTQYGLSGTAVLDVSESLSIAIHRQGRKDAAVVVDLVPFLSEAALAEELARRRKRGWTDADLLTGLLPGKFSLALAQVLEEAGAGTGRGARSFVRTLATGLKRKTFLVTGTRGWNEAEFTAGGVDAREVAPGTLGSKLIPGLYFAGEVLDVQGGRGGYNLAWAWSSGYVAGLCE